MGKRTKELEGRLAKRQKEGFKLAADLAEFPTVTDENRKEYEEKKTDLRKAHEETKELKERIELVKQSEDQEEMFKELVEEDEETREDTPRNEPEEFKTISEKIIYSKEWQRHKKDRSSPFFKTFSIFDEMKATAKYKATFGTGQVTGGPTGSGASSATAPAYLQSIFMPGFTELIAHQEPMMLDLPRMRRTQTGTVNYRQEKTRTNEVQRRAEGAIAQESLIDTESKKLVCESYATAIPVTDEAMEDDPQAVDLIYEEINSFLREDISEMILTSDGTGDTFTGIISTTGINSIAKAGADNIFDKIHEAITDIQTTGFIRPDFAVLHHNDWHIIRTARSTNGDFYFGNPATAGLDTLFGLTRILTTEVTEHTAVLGNRSKMGMWVRDDFTVDTGFSGDDFKKFQRTIRANVRLVFAVIRPKAFALVTGLDSTSG